MTSKMLPALCAALLLAACNTTGGSDTSMPQQPQIAAAAPAGPTTVAGIEESPFSTTVGNTVHFETDSFSLDTPAQTTLQKQAAWLQQNRQHSVTVEGYADERGTREYNLALGERRAQAVLNYLAALGIDGARMKEISYGKEKPVCPDSTETCWNENRRGVTTLDN